MALFDAFQQIGKKEDVSDIITNISPTKTPFQTMIGSDKVHNTLFQWQEDSLAAAAVNAQIEGFTASDATLTATVMRQNYTQIFQKTIKVSNTAEAVSTYGRAKEAAYQMSKASAEVKRDLEFALVNTQQTAVAGASGTTARKFAGAQAQIDVTNATTKTGAGGNPITETLLLTNLQLAYNNGADPSVIMVTPADSQVIAGFAAATGRLRDIGAGGKTLVNAVNLYVSPFGESKVVLNRFLNTVDTLVLDPDMWKLATLRSWTRETLAKTGDNLMMMLVGEFSLKHKNVLGSGRIWKSA